MYQAFDDFILRTPLLPFNTLKFVTSKIEGYNFYITNDIVQEAVYIASIELYSALLKLDINDISIDKNEKIFYSLIKYILRMSTRCTPFGLFANCMIGKIGSESKLNIPKKINRSVKLDMLFLCQLSKVLSKDRTLIEKILYYPNSSIYKVGENYRYVESILELNKIKYRISTFESDCYIYEVLKNAPNGMTLKDLSYILLNLDYSLREEDIFSYLYTLIDQQILVSQLEPLITGKDYFEYIIDLLIKTNYDEDILSVLLNIKQLLSSVEDSRENNVLLYKNIENSINILPYEFDKKYLFKVDTIRKPENLTLDKCVLDNLQSLLVFLGKVTQSKNSVIEDFIVDFKNKYSNQEIPLLIVLDPDIGLGYPRNKSYLNSSLLLDDLLIPIEHIKRKLISLNEFELIMLNKLIKSVSSGNNVIKLLDSDFDEIKNNDIKYPNTLSVLFELYGDECADINLISVMNSASNLYSRFSCTDSDIEKYLKRVALKELEYIPNNSILSEIVHLPNYRIGNIIHRPHFREKELVYLSGTDLSDDNKIILSDLTLSVRNDRLFLYSKRYKKEIIPKLTVAHNYYTDVVPVYRFLCDLQNQDCMNSLSFSWGRLADELIWLPRVVYNNIILSPETWNVKVDSIKKISLINEDDKFLREVVQWRESLSIPSRFMLLEGDNKLFIDSSNILHLRLFFDLIKKRNTVKLIEFVFKDEFLVKDESYNGYINEFIVSFYKK